MLEEAKTHCLRSIELEPNVAESHCNLGIVLQKQRKFAEAAVACRTALRIDPQNGIAHLTLGIVLFELGNLEEAQVPLAEAVRLRPDDAVAPYYLAGTSQKQGKPAEAVAHYGLALQHNPDGLEALLGLASLRLTAQAAELRNPEEAVTLARRACELTRYEQPVTLDILGMAYALTGRFSDAVATTERALRIARAAGNDELVRTMQKRLELYKRRQLDTSPSPQRRS
jgi:protein O-GlcNAc transferase